jgi:hypothetical protein
LQKEVQRRAAETPTPTTGAFDGPQADQTQQASAQPAQAAAAPDATAGLTNGTTAPQNLGAQAAPAGGTQGKAPRATAEQLTGAQERWQRMTTAERQAVAARTDVKPILRKNLHGAKWENLNVDVQRKLQGAMEPIEAQPSDMKAFKPETGILHGIAQRAADGTADGTAAAVETGRKAVPLAELAWDCTLRHQAATR